MCVTMQGSSRLTDIPTRSRFRRYLLLAAQLLIVLALLDGAVDLAYSGFRAANKAVFSHSVQVATQHERPASWNSLVPYDLPVAGHGLRPISAEGLHVDANGLRSTGNPPRQGAKGMVIGSSQAFGHYVRDDATLAAALERTFPDVTLRTLAGPSRTVPQSMAYWRKVEPAIEKPDFALFLFSNTETILGCGRPPVSATASEPALVGVSRRALRKIAGKTDNIPCGTQEARDAVVELVLYELQAAQAYSEARGVPMVIVIAPLVYGSANRDNAFRGAYPNPIARSIDLTIDTLRQRLVEKPIPGVIDLSNAFAGKGDSYFIDRACHFNRAGAEKLAAEIARRVPRSFFEDRRS